MRINKIKRLFVGKFFVVYWQPSKFTTIENLNENRVKRRIVGEIKDIEFKDNLYSIYFTSQEEKIDLTSSIVRDLIKKSIARVPVPSKVVVNGIKMYILSIEDKEKYQNLNKD